jgi:hypothetical protein
MADTIIWSDSRAWAIPNTDEQNRQLRKYGGSSDMPGAAYGAKGPAVVTRQYAEQVRSQTGKYPANSRIIEIDGTETNRPGVTPPSTGKSWGEFLTMSPSSAAAKEQQLWSRATGQNPPPTIQTLPQQLSERRGQTEAVIQNPRGAMAQPRFQAGQAYSQPAISRPPVATSDPYRPLTGITYKHEAGPNTSNAYEAMRLTRSIDAEKYGSVTLPQNIEDINRGGRYSPMAYGERPRAADELRRELRDPMYQSKYDFKGVMAEQEAQQMVQEADKAAQESRQKPATTQSGVTPAQGSMHGQQSEWISARSLGYGHSATQHRNGRWYLDYDINNPWG